MKLRQRVLLGALFGGLALVGCGGADMNNTFTSTPNAPLPPRQDEGLGPDVIRLMPTGLRSGTAQSISFKTFQIAGNEVSFINNDSAAHRIVSMDCPELNATVAPGQTIRLSIDENATAERMSCSFSDAMNAGNARWSGTLYFNIVP